MGCVEGRHYALSDGRHFSLHSGLFLTICRLQLFVFFFFKAIWKSIAEFCYEVHLSKDY